MTKARTLADMISDGVIGTTELADDVITPVKLDETGSYVVSTMTANGGSGAVTLAANSDIRATTGTWTGEHSGKIQYHNNEWYFQFADKMIGRNGSAVNVFTVDNTGSGYFASDIGIGTASIPSDASLAISNDIKLEVGTSDSSRIYAKSTGTGAYNLGTSGGSAVVFHRLADNSDEIGFETHHAGNNHTERMRLNYHGQLTLEGTGLAFDTTPSKNGLQLYYESDSGIATIASYSNGGGTQLDFQTNTGAGATDRIMTINTAGVVVNPDAEDKDFRVASDNNSNMLLVDGSTNRVGVGTNSPTHDLTIGMSDLGDASLSFRSSTYSSLGTIKVSHDSGTAESSMRFHTRTGGNEPERMRITSAGLIGVNTISPTQEVSVAGNIDLQSTSGSNATMRRIAWRNTNSSGFEVSNIQGHTGANIYEGQIAFQTKDSGGSLNERMRIDSAGRVTMPYQPSFQASGSGGWSSDITQDTWYKLPFTSTAFNTGSYSTSSYNFTAPVAGKYLFIFNVYAHHNNPGDNNDYFSVRYGVNGSTQNYHSINGYQNQGDDDTTTSQSAILSLAQNDTVQVFIRGHGTTVRYYGSNCYFFGQLLG
jgi:hypothetical protein